jgi:MFS transporter, FSR family, fosmidomycin resistance protein
MPLPRLLADNNGPRSAFVVLATIPLPAIAMSTTLREPAHDIFPSDT